MNEINIPDITWEQWLQDHAEWTAQILAKRNGKFFDVEHICNQFCHEEELNEDILNLWLDSATELGAVTPKVSEGV